MSRPEHIRKLHPLPNPRFSASNRFSISPVPSRSSNLSLIQGNSLYHKRHITAIIQGPYKHSTSMRSSCSYSYESHKGFNPSNPSKDNQDSVFLHPYFSRDCKIFGICDGHGSFGKEVSGFIASNLPSILQHKALNVKSLEESVKALDGIVKNCGVDTNFSGSTLCFCLIQKKKLFTVNVGDSRAILGRKGFIRWEAIQLSVDHKPDIPSEASRIRSCGGRVSQSGNVGPMRVWMAEKNSPGLAMSRSIGDSLIHSFGVSSDPDVFERHLTEEDEFLVIGSDGLFEFLSNQDVATIVGDHLGDAKAACEELISTSRSRWARVIPI